MACACKVKNFAKAVRACEVHPDVMVLHSKVSQTVDIFELVCQTVLLLLYFVLDHKKWVKTGKNSNTSYENKIYRVDSHSKEDSKNVIFCQGGPNFEGGLTGQFKENGQKQENLLLCKLESTPF